MNALQRTRLLIARRAGVPESKLTPARTLESLGLDSLAALELLIDIEDEIGRRLSPGPQRLKTLGQIFALVEPAGAPGAVPHILNGGENETNSFRRMDRLPVPERQPGMGDGRLSPARLPLELPRPLVGIARRPAARAGARMGNEHHAPGQPVGTIHVHRGRRDANQGHRQAGLLLAGSRVRGRRLPGAMPNYTALWWRSPGASEARWGVNIEHQGDILFATWVHV